MNELAWDERGTCPRCHSGATRRAHFGMFALPLPPSRPGNWFAGCVVDASEIVCLTCGHGWHGPRGLDAVPIDPDPNGPTWFELLERPGGMWPDPEPSRTSSAVNDVDTTRGIVVQLRTVAAGPVDVVKPFDGSGFETINVQAPPDVGEPEVWRAVDEVVALFNHGEVEFCPGDVSSALAAFYHRFASVVVMRGGQWEGNVVEARWIDP